MASIEDEVSTWTETANALANALANAIFNVSREGRAVLQELVDGVGTLHGRALNLNIEADKLKANFMRVKNQAEHLLKRLNVDRSNANLKQRVTYNTSLLTRVKELSGTLETLVKEIYNVATKAANDKSTSVYFTCGKGVLAIGGILVPFRFPGYAKLVASVIMSGSGVYSLLVQAYNSYRCNLTVDELRRLAVDAQKFLLKIDELKMILEDKAEDLEAEKQGDD